MLVLLLSLLGCSLVRAASVWNGWYPCKLEVPGTALNIKNVSAECATVTAPLCHPGVCQDLQQRTVDLFVKRIRATSAAATDKPNVWLFPDRTQDWSLSYSHIDKQLLSLYLTLNGDADVYTMDQRGTGRSTKLDCLASQATMPLSPGGTSVSPTEVTACSTEVATIYGDFLVSFSVTSAALDAVYYMTQFQSGTKITVYGVGLGTIVAERLLLQGVAEVVGYVFDGVAFHTGSADANSVPFRSRADGDYNDVALDFLGRCSKDATCSTKFSNMSVVDTLRSVYSRLDGSSKSDYPCRDLIASFATNGDSAPESTTFRKFLASFFEDEDTRSVIPVLIYRMNRCLKKDRLVVGAALAQQQAAMTKLAVEVDTKSRLGFDIIQFSELWENPPPTDKDLQATFTNALISPGNVYDQLPRYCAFSGDQSSACSAFPAAGKTFVYTRDTASSAVPAIPPQASVLVLSSALDAQTPHKYAMAFMDSLEGSAKQLITLPAASHGQLSHVWGLENASLCSMEIIRSYVSAKGSLRGLQTTCVDQLPALSFNVPVDVSRRLLNVTDAYEGDVNDGGGVPARAIGGGNATIAPGSNDGTSTSAGSTEQLEKEKKRYQVAFLIVLILLIMVLAIVVIVLYRWWNLKRLRDEEAKLRKMRGEEEDEMEMLRGLWVSSPYDWNYHQQQPSSAHM
ncbi:TPA: hypothetical protein N0F65_000760 [Lagenidium giganteum]|uniref:Peptidase S33 tripeptidyl aminopeptidase-like C-terminal domain-containing protein n=1 Tax=Lagenidium giganteum TaxID=4803 RepID=A0AAV2ZJQ0_9STRA|nr:TPA: hypothetical protein N0F65_000760 [Lagenidium giganteum]